MTKQTQQSTPATETQAEEQPTPQFDVVKTGYVFRAIADADDARTGYVFDSTTPAAATGATQGQPGTFTPVGSQPPLALANMTGITASPATAWLSGRWVDLRDNSKAYWNGTAWVAGVAP
jgi:hypothetical protein